MENNEIVIIVPFYNPGEFLDKCIASVISQKYNNYKVIFIDDCSTDGSYDKLPHNDEKVTIIRNDIRKTALENIHDAVMKYCNQESVCVLVDGDDWLINKNVLKFIDEQYQKNDCWISYGQASWTDGRRGFASAYSPEEFLNIRKAPFRVSHIRTFRAGLYKAMQVQDPDFSGLKDNDGK